MKYDLSQKRQCTLPALFHVRVWFENKFGDLCEAHDLAYVLRTGKWEADMAFLRGMWQRGPKVMVIPTFLMFNTIGFWYYYT